MPSPTPRGGFCHPSRSYRSGTSTQHVSCHFRTIRQLDARLGGRASICETKVRTPGRLITLILLATLNCDGALADTLESPLKAPPPQEWQVRREKLDHVIAAARQNDPVALKQFDQILTDMENHPLDRTPLEALDIVGTYYMPNEGIESSLTLIVTQLVLGWYDVLRFASPSGRAEIVDHEQFFNRALVLSGKALTDTSLKFLNEHQDRVLPLVEAGVMYADKFRETPTYDRRWPSAYGLERSLCASGEAEKCKAPPSLPKDQWDAAWAASQKAVTDYFVKKH